MGQAFITGTGRSAGGAGRTRSIQQAMCDRRISHFLAGLHSANLRFQASFWLPQNGPQSCAAYEAANECGFVQWVRG